MFDTLSDQMKADEQGTVSAREKLVRWSMAVLITIVLLLGIYFLPQLG